MDNLSNSSLIVLALIVLGLLGALALVVFGITAYRIAVLYAPPDTTPRPIPAFGRARLEPADAEADVPVEKGVNGYPAVAPPDAASQIAGAAEMTLVGERDQWWAEKREDGLTDDEIAEEEARRVVPVFED